MTRTIDPDSQLRHAKLARHVASRDIWSLEGHSLTVNRKRVDEAEDEAEVFGLDPLEMESAM